MKRNKQQARFGNQWWYPELHKQISKNAFTRRIDRWIERANFKHSPERLVKIKAKLRTMIPG